MITDLLGGQIVAAVDNLSASLEHIRAGKLRALAVTTVERSPALPDVPALNELMPPVDATAWVGIGAPKQTPVEIIERLNREVNAGLVDPKIAARLTEIGGTAFLASPAELDRFVVEQTDMWGKVVRDAHITAE